MVQGFESSVDTYACIVDVCSPSGKPAGICSMNCRLWYFFTQIFYFWVFILKKFQQNKISTWAQTCVRSLTLQQFLNSSCPRTEFCECGWERITSVVSLTSSWNLSFLLQLWMWATNHSNASSTSDFITNREYRYFHVIIVAEILKYHLYLLLPWNLQRLLDPPSDLT